MVGGREIFTMNDMAMIGKERKLASLPILIIG